MSAAPRVDFAAAWAREGRGAVGALFARRFPAVDWEAHLRDPLATTAYELWWRGHARGWPDGRVTTDMASLRAGFERLAERVVREVCEIAGGDAGAGVL